MPHASKKIDASGQLVSDGNENNTSSSSSSSSSSSRRFFSCSQQRLDIFGFSLTPSQFLTVSLFVLLILGPKGFLGFLIALAAYMLFQYVTSSHRGSTTGGRRWGGNIHGMKDLPKPPPPKGG